MSRTKLVPCTIERGGFSSERTFEITMPDGSKVLGTADVEYLRDQNKEQLGDDEPPLDEKMSGYVECRVIRKIGNELLLEFPSTDVVRLAEEEFTEMAC